MKRVLVVLLVIVIGLSAAVLAAEKTKIGIVTDTAGVGDLSFNDMAIIGANAAAEKYGLEVVILQSITAADYLPNLRNFADTEEYLLIVGVGYLLGDAIDVVAQEYPDQMFGIIDFPNIWGHPNVMGLIYREEQMSSLVGCLAGMIAAHYDSDTVGIVFGLDIPILYHFEGGYRFGLDYGLKKYEELYGKAHDVSLVYTYAGSFDDPAIGYTNGKTQLELGASSIFNVAGQLGIGMEEAVTEFHGNAGTTQGPPYFFGVDANQDYLGLGMHALMSGLKRVDTGVILAATEIVEGTWVGRTVVFDLANNGVGYSNAEALLSWIPFGTSAGKATEADYYNIISNWAANRANLPFEFWTTLDELAAAIISGDVVVPYADNLEQINAVRAEYPFD